MLDLLPAELYFYILTYTCTSDLLNLRLVSREMRRLTEMRLRQMAFRHIRLDINDTIRLERAVSHIKNSSLANNIRWVVLAGIDRPSPAQFGRFQLRLKLIDVLTIILDALQKHSPLMTDLTIEGIKANLGINSQPEMLHQDLHSSLLLNNCSKTVLISLKTVRSMLECLELDRVTISVADIWLLADFAAGAKKLKRLTFRLFDNTDEQNISDQSIAASARVFAEASSNSLEELVVYSTRIEPADTRHDNFLSIFLNVARLPCLQYLYLEGFRISYNNILQFLEVHKTSIEEHGYRDFYFTDLENISNAEFEQLINHGLQARGLSQLAYMHVL